MPIGLKKPQSSGRVDPVPDTEEGTFRKAAGGRIEKFWLLYGDQNLKVHEVQQS